MPDPTEGEDLQSADGQELQDRVAALEREAAPVRTQLDSLRARIDVLRTELRRRRRLEELNARQATRAGLRAGDSPTIEEVVSGARTGLDEGAGFDAFRFLRDSGTEVRLGYAASANQSISFTDGRQAEEAMDFAGARRMWEQGWEFGTPAARGVRVYPVGSRSEKVIPAPEVHVEER